MAREYDQTNPSPQDDTEHNGNEDVPDQACHHADSFRKPIRNERDGDMLPPL